MKAKTTIFLLALCIRTSAQEWTQRADLSGVARWGASGFGIGNTGYICSGTDGLDLLNDLWAWDQTTDTWSEREPFPGTPRREGVAFALDGIGYYGFGRIGVGQYGLDDLWAYDPVLDSWEQRASLPTLGRSAPSVFVLNGKAYLIGGNPVIEPYLTDLWEYDPVADTWTEHASLPATGRSAPVAFAVNGKGYVGSGNDNSSNYACKDFWQWDPETDQWTQLNDMPGPERRTACYFPFDDLPIAGGGWDGGTYFTDFHAYHAATDQWSALPDFEGFGAHTPVSFHLNGRGYVGTGGIPGGQTNQYWEFDKDGMTSVIEAAGSGKGTIDMVIQGGTITLLDRNLLNGDRYLVRDALGRTVLHGTLYSAIIPIHGLGAGRYILQVIGSTGGSSSRAFITLAE